MKLKRFAAAVLAFCLMLTLLPGGASADVTPASGEGWVLSADGVLTVTMAEVSSGSAGWSVRSSDILKVVIGSGVESVSGSAFTSCVSLTAFGIEGENDFFSVGDDGVLYSRNGDTIVCYPAARGDIYVVPKTVVMIQRSAFSGLTTSGGALKIFAYEDTISSVETNAGQSGGARFPVEAEPYVPVTGVRLSEEVLSIDIGDTVELRATVLPEGATFSEVSWTTSNGYVASVEPDEDGNAVAFVEGLTAGEAVITVTTSKNNFEVFTASCTVRVEKRDVEGLTLSPKPLTLKEGVERTLTATLTPVDATYKTVTFLSTDRSVVEVVGDDGNSKDFVTRVAEEVAGTDSASAEVDVRAIGPGAASVVAITQDLGRYDVCEVVVPEVRLNDLTLRIGRTETLHATVIPGNAVVTGKTWKSDDKNVATVDDDGMVTAKGKGTTNITLSGDVGGVPVTAACTVTVDAVATNITIGQGGQEVGALTMYVGGNTEKLNAAVEPSEAVDKTVIWTSSDELVAKVSDDGTVTAEGPGRAAIVATAKDGGLADSCVVTVWNPTTEVHVNKTSLTLTKGQEEALSATVNPDADPSVTWSSDKPEFATVDAKTGVVHAVEAGEAKIIATSVADNTRKAECAVTVIAPAVPVTGVKLDKYTLNLAEGDSDTLTATVLPEGADNRDVTWESTDTAVAEVDGNGKVTAKKSGKATIIVTTADGRHTAKCAVTVLETSVTKLEVSPDACTLTVGEDRQLSATVTPDTATYGSVKWFSSDDRIAKVNETTGVVHAEAVGTAAITAATADGRHTGTCLVTVKPVPVAVTSITLDEDTLVMNVKDSVLLTATVDESATDKTVTWTSDKPGIASVDQNGIVTAKAPGTAAITASAGGQTAVCNVTVLTPANGVTLSPKTLTLAPGQENLLTATVGAAEGTPSNNAVKWISSDTSVAQVADGRVTAAGAGRTTIIAVSEDGGFTDSCTVKVPGVHPIVPSALRVGETAELTAIIMPAGLAGTTVWSVSGNASVENGVITAGAEGSATVTATFTTVDGVAVSKDCTVTITAVTANEVTHISLDPPALELNVGSTQPLEAIVETGGRPDTTLALTVTVTDKDGNEDNTVVRVDALSSGREFNVTALNPGTALVTVSAGAYEATCVVTVPDIPVSSVSLNHTAWTLEKGRTLTLTATVAADPGMGIPTKQTVKWLSSDTNVARLDKNETNNGDEYVTVTAEGAGKAAIIAVSEDGGITAVCEITVPGIELNKTVLTLPIGETEELFAILTHTGVGTVTWTSDKEDIATVDGSGKVTAVAKGEATITAKVVVTEDVTVSESCVVTVPDKLVIRLNNTSLTMTAGIPGNIAQLTVLDGQAVTWSSSNTGVATVSGGFVTAVSGGTAVITATAVEDRGATASCVVKVWNKTTRVELSKPSLTLARGDSWTLTAKVPDDEDPAVTWSSSNTGVATVDRDGKVEAVSAGDAVITATAVADGAVTAKCDVTVPEYMVSGTVGAPTVTISESDGQRTVTLRLANGKDGDEIWYRTPEDSTYRQYDDSPIPVEQDLTIMACTRNGNYQSVVVTGYVFADGETGKTVLTDSMGNEIDTLPEAGNGEDLAFWANITLDSTASAEAKNIYLAVYDEHDDLILLERFVIDPDGTGEPDEAEGTEGQVISKFLRLKIPDGTKIKRISLMVLSSENVPVISAGTLSD